MKYEVNGLVRVIEIFENKKEITENLKKLFQKEESRTNGTVPGEITHISRSTMSICLKETYSPMCTHLLETLIIDKFENMRFEKPNEN